MLWFTMQSVLMLLLAFAVGLLVGWLAWGRQWKPLDQLPADAHGALDGVRRRNADRDAEQQTDAWPFGTIEDGRGSTAARATTSPAPVAKAPTILPVGPITAELPVLEPAAEPVPDVAWGGPDAETPVPVDVETVVDVEPVAEAEPLAVAETTEADETVADETGADEPVADETGADEPDVEAATEDPAEDPADDPADEPAAPAAVAWERPAPEFDWTAGATTALDFAAPTPEPVVLSTPTEVDVDAFWGSASDVGVLTAEQILAGEGEPAVQDPADHEPAATEEPADAPVAVEEPAAEDSAAEDSAAEDSAADEPADDEPVVEKPVAEKPFVKAPSTASAPLPGDALPAAPAARIIDLTRVGDDLTRIDGITDLMAAALQAEGFSTFASVAGATEDQLRRALRVNRIRSAPGIATWSARAAELVQAGADQDDPIEVVADPGQDSATASTGAEAGVTPASAAPAPRQAGDAKDADTKDGDAKDAGRRRTADDELADADREWLARRWREVEERTEAPVAAEPEPAAAVVEGDDLERVVGVTAKISDTLRAAGISTYAQLAAARDDELRALLKDAGLRFPPALSTWAVQAALLLQGDAEGAATLAGGLMVGQETS